MKRGNLAIIMLAGLAAAASAQYDQTVAVEGKYVPEIISSDRLGMFPKPVRFAAAESSLDYSLGGVVANFTPNALPLPATGWRDVHRFSKAPGYLELGIGSYLNSTLNAGYRIIDNAGTVAGIRLQHNSTSLWHPRMSNEMRDVRMWRYDESLGVYGSHKFDGYGRLDAGIDYHVGNFNYYGTEGVAQHFYPSPDREGKAPTQTLNDISLRVGWQSASAVGRPDWSVAAGVRYFGYRSLYERPDLQGENTRLSGGRETHVWLNGTLAYRLSTASDVGFNLGGDIMTYADYEKKGNNGYTIEAPDTYEMISLTPFYRYSANNLSIKVGANIDLTFNAGPKGNRYGVFHVSPDVTADYRSGGVTLYAHMRGGTSLHTLASARELDYYSAPAIFNTTPVYTPLDAVVGVDFGPFSGFNAGLHAAYRISRNQFLGGWYQTALNTPVIYGGVSGSFYYEGMQNLSGYSLGVHAGYDAGRWFRLEGKADYQPQKADKGYFNGFDRSRLTCLVSLESNPWRTLKLRLEYDWRGVRGLPLLTDVVNPDGELTQEAVLVRLSDLTMLNFGAFYQVTDPIGVWIQADNLLNRRNARFPSLPEQGIRLSAGLSWIF
ncbi:MAG: hypothetical protein NC204_00065 [Candidatus Amulumruptor caecigallinarius]|nr:hypothetical protein [Candidatus Amulumruptor caecigallinarius]